MVQRDFDHKDIARFTQIDYDREMAFIATAPDEKGDPETLGVMRTNTKPDNSEAEFAIVVRSDMKGEGLGSMLFHKGIRYTKDRGTTVLTGQTMVREQGHAGAFQKVRLRDRARPARRGPGGHGPGHEQGGSVAVSPLPVRHHTGLESSGGATRVARLLVDAMTGPDLDATLSFEVAEEGGAVTPPGAFGASLPPDAIPHLHCSGDWPALLGSLPEGRRAVITLHDCELFTGGCTYPLDCDRARTAGAPCPATGNMRTRTRSKRKSTG